MRLIFYFLVIPFYLIALESHPITPSPVLGFHAEAFGTNSEGKPRQFFIWYPVKPEEKGTSSSNQQDKFYVAIDAPLAPSAIKRKPIIISHGYSGGPHDLAWLIRDLVSAGFIAIGIQHEDIQSGAIHINHWKRAQEISQIISQLEASRWNEIADFNNTGVVGFSLGGTTALWLAGGISSKLDTLAPTQEYSTSLEFLGIDKALPLLNKDMMAKNWRDSRVKAVFVMAPAWSWIFDPDSLKKISIPVYLVGGESDEIIITRNNAGLFARNIPNAFYQLIPGKTGHFVFLSGFKKQLDQGARENKRLFQDDATVDRDWIQSQVGREAVDFFRSKLTLGK